MCRRFQRPKAGRIKTRTTVMAARRGGRFSVGTQRDMVTDSEQRIAENPKAWSPGNCMGVRGWLKGFKKW